MLTQGIGLRTVTVFTVCTVYLYGYLSPYRLHLTTMLRWPYYIRDYGLYKPYKYGTVTAITRIDGEHVAYK
jgi:hypothetical protein